MDITILGVSALIQSIGILFTVCNFYREKISVLKKVLFIITLTVIFFFMLMYSSNFTRLIINYIGMLFSIYFILVDKNIKKAIPYATAIFLLSAIIEVILTIILKSVIDFDYLYNKYPLIMLFFTLLVNIILVLITRLKFINKFINKFNLSNRKVLLILFFIILMCSLITIQNKNIINPSSISYIINILMFIFVILITYIIIFINNKNNDISNKYNQMMEYVTEYENIIDEQGKKNHEYKNQLLILNGFIDNKKKLKEYLNTIIDDHKTGQNYEIRQLSHFPNGGLKGLLYYKISKMKENNIKYYLYVSKEVTKPLEKIDIKNYKDITKIFGVLIDNAIDASLESNLKEITMDFKMDDDFLIVTITNSCSSDLDISKIGSGYTSKGKGHGYGLRLVRDIIKNNKNLELVTDKNNNEFTQTLLIDTK